MGITFEFPSSLDVGHCIAVIGHVGKSRFVMKLVSDFKAFDPDLLLSPASEVPLPVGETIPLEVTLDTSGEWEVCGSTPETSTNASGFSAARNGFRTGEQFICKIYVKKDYFEVYLNGICLSLSEHMIPVSCIQSVVIEGDCRIGRMFYGEVAAVEKSTRRSAISFPQHLRSNKTLNQQNLEEAKVVECILREPSTETDLDLTASLHSLLESPQKIGSDQDNRPLSEFTSFSLTNLHRASSYQLVFDVSDGEDDNTTEAPALNRANSCSTLTASSHTVIKRPSLLAAPKPIPLRSRNLQQLLPLQNELRGFRPSRPVPPNKSTDGSQNPVRSPMARTGFAIKVSHPVVQMRGGTAPPQALPASTARTTASIGRPTRDFLDSEQRARRLPSRIPVHVKKVPSSGELRRRSVTLSIR